MAVPNPLAYYDTATIIAKKSFTVQALGNIRLGFKWLAMANTLAYYTY